MSNSIRFAKRKAFGPVAPTSPHVKHVGYMWVFVRKCNEKNEIVRYKAHPLVQGFSQRPGIDYEECIPRNACHNVPLPY